jgi:Tol biopolymer transport system component
VYALRDLRCSRTGRWLLFDGQSGPNDEAVFHQILVRPDGSDLHELHCYEVLQWTPAGDRLWFAGQTTLWSVRPDGTGAGSIPNTVANPTGLVSPNGSRIAYRVDIQIAPHVYQGTRTWLMETDGTRRYRLRAPPGSTVPEAWSPDGTTLIVMRDTGSIDGDRPYFVQPDGTVLGRLPVLTYDVSWSPTGDRVLYQEPDGRIVTSRPDGTEVNQVGFDTTGGEPDAVWQPIPIRQ